MILTVNHQMLIQKQWIRGESQGTLLAKNLLCER